MDLKLQPGSVQGEGHEARGRWQVAGGRRMVVGGWWLVVTVLKR